MPESKALRPASGRLGPALDRRSHIIRQFEEIIGETPDLLRPKTFNEKIQWLKLYHRDPLMTRASDKCAAREYVDEVIGRGHTLELLGAWEDPREIDFDALPDQFVLKAAGGYGMNIFCVDRGQFDIDAARTKLTDWLRPQNNHYFYSYEWAYKDIPPRVIAEPLIGEPGAVQDHKLFCFSGEPHAFLVTTEISKQETLTDLFSLDWEQQLFSNPLRRPHPEPPARPREHARMIDFARRLSQPFPFVRIDFFETPHDLFVGEFTFYSGNGMIASTEPSMQNEFGALLRLPLRSWPRALAVEAAARLVRNGSPA